MRSPAAPLLVTAALTHHGGGTVLSGALAPVSLPALPSTFSLLPAHPNPFNPETTLTVYLPRRASARLCIYDILGQPVRLLAAAALEPGAHTFTWRGRDDDGRQVGAGVFFVEFQAGEHHQVRKLLLLK